MNEDDPVLVEEQAHLDELYKQLLGFRDDLTHQLEHDHKQAAADLVTMSEEIRPDFGGADETMETLAAIETLNAVIDAYTSTMTLAWTVCARCCCFSASPISPRSA